MGRDHTLFALQSGFVKYYRNPALNPKRQYIGIVFDKTDTLPAPANAARKRRLGMVSIPRRDLADVEAEDAEVVIGDIGTIATSGDIGTAMPSSQLPVRQAASLSPVDIASIPQASKRARKEAKRRAATGRIPASELGMRPDYSYRESNYQIGKAAERAGVKVRLFQKGDRFLAWRKRTARIARNAEKRAIGKKKGKKDKPARGGTRKGVGQPLTN